MFTATQGFENGNLGQTHQKTVKRQVLFHPQLLSLYSLHVSSSMRLLNNSCRYDSRYCMMRTFWKVSQVH